MVIYVVVGIVVVALLAIELGFVAPPTASILIQVQGGAVHLARGSLSNSVLAHIDAILRDASVVEGFVAISAGRRLSFSRQIPEDARQRLRNVLFNHMR
jgi:hypothetical protein